MFGVGGVLNSRVRIALTYLLQNFSRFIDLAQKFIFGSDIFPGMGVASDTLNKKSNLSEYHILK